MSDYEVTESCGNVFEDLGLSDADEVLVKSNLAAAIQQLIESKGLTQTKAAQLIGLSQPKLSDMFKGKFRGISEAKMMECITRLGQDIRIEILPQIKPHSERGHIQVCAPVLAS